MAAWPYQFKINTVNYVRKTTENKRLSDSVRCGDIFRYSGSWIVPYALVDRLPAAISCRQNVTVNRGLKYQPLLYLVLSRVYTDFALVPAPAVRQAGHAQPDTGWSIETEADRQLVLEQLDRMLSSPVFRGSKRLSGFLRYIVIDTLDNGGAELKERLIGVHVFGRPADYDTSAEPVVRVSAGDLRKRIAQYYHEPACEHELRIDLPVGSYHPVFHLPSPVASPVTL